MHLNFQLYKITSLLNESWYVNLVCSELDALPHTHRFGYLLLVLVATIGRILVQNKGEGLIHREYLTMTHDDVIKEYCDGVF